MSPASPAIPAAVTAPNSSLSEASYAGANANQPYTPTPQELEAMLPPSIRIQQERAASAGRKMAWLTALSAVAGVALPLAFREKIGKSLPLRIAVSVFSGLGAGLVGAVTSGYFLMKRVARQNREMVMAYDGAMDGLPPIAKSEQPNPMALGEVSAQAGNPLPVMVDTSDKSVSANPLPVTVDTADKSFAASMQPRDARHATQVANDAITRASAPSVPTV